MLSCFRRMFGSKKRKFVFLPRARPQIESLQERVLPSTVLLNAQRQVVIQGTTGDDVVLVTKIDSTLRVAFNAETFEFAAPKVRSIVFRGYAGNDQFTNSTDLRAVALGGEGNDTLTAGGGNDLLIGSIGDDTLNGGGGHDVLLGQAGNDNLNGGLGADQALGGLGDDTLHGDDGRDLLHGQEGKDDIFGDMGDDRLFGEAGDDHLQGGLGNDRLHGGADNDSLDGGFGLDRVEGGGGDDHGFHVGEDFSRGVEARHTGDDNELVARLVGSVVGRAKFETELEHGVQQNKFEMEIQSGPANTVFTLCIDGANVGTVTTDSLGLGQFALRSATFTVVSGSTIELKDASSAVVSTATFALDADDDNDAGELFLTANLSGASSALGSAKFKVEQEAGTTTTEFEVKVKSGPTLQTLTVFINGVSRGQFTTGDSGNGELENNNPGFTVAAADTIVVKDAFDTTIVTGIFQVA